MIRYQILIEYVGTYFIGWQTQKKGNSVQKVIQNILSKLLKERIKLHGSGRTDKGVHALEQSAHFDCKNKILDTKKFIKSLNFFLNKKNISILKIKLRNNQFHSRFSAKEREYKYIILNRNAPPVLDKNKVWHLRSKLDMNLLKKAAVDYSVFYQSGEPERVISDHVEKYGVDLLVMGAYGHSRIRNLIIGSTTTQMIRSCLVPVLLFR